MTNLVCCILKLNEILIALHLQLSVLNRYIFRAHVVNNRSMPSLSEYSLSLTQALCQNGYIIFQYLAICSNENVPNSFASLPN